MTKKTSTDTNPFSLRAASAEFTRLEDQHNQLCLKRAELFDEMCRLARTIRQRNKIGTKHVKPAERPENAAALALLGRASPPVIEADDEHVETLQTQIRAHDEAIRLVELDLALARRDASATVCKKLEPEHRALVRKLIDALQTLQVAHRDYSDFADRVNREGVHWREGISPMQITEMGHPRDRRSVIARYFRDAIKQGYMSQTEIPAELRS